MKPRFVSAVAVLICAAILGMVGLFAYSRYRKAQEENAAFRQQLQTTGESQQTAPGVAPLLPAATPAGSPRED
jgi:hypothetical protein